MSVDQKQFDDLKKQVEELTRFVQKKDAQQLTAPLDVVSQKIVYENVPLFKGQTTNTPTADGYITVDINGRTYTILTGA